MKSIVLALLIASALVAAKPQAEEQRASDIEKQLIDTVVGLIQNPALSDVIYQDEELSEWAKEILGENRDGRILLTLKAKLALKFLAKLSLFGSLFTTTTTTAATVAGRRRR